MLLFYDQGNATFLSLLLGVTHHAHGELWLESMDGSQYMDTDRGLDALFPLACMRFCSMLSICCTAHCLGSLGIAVSCYSVHGWAVSSSQITGY